MAGQKVAESLFQDRERTQDLSSLGTSGFLRGSGGGGVSDLTKLDVPEPATEPEVLEEWKSRVSVLAEIEGKDGFGIRLGIREGVEEEFVVDHIKEAREFEEDAKGFEGDPYTPLGSAAVDPQVIQPPGIYKERWERKALSGERNTRTEEVRSSVNAEDPATIREIGVTVAVTPTVLPDGAIRMKIRPRSAQGVEEIIGQSGHKYPRVSESMLERITQIPEGHSLVVGGFYGQVKQKGDKKVPTLGDLPAINLFLMDQAQKADKETASVAFVLTPATHKSESTGKDEVVIETRVFSMNNSSAGRRVVDWSSSLDADGVPLETIGRLNSLFGLEDPPAEAGKGGDRKSREIATSDGSIVLSPTQLDGVLRELKRGGLATQTSNPTLITEDNEQATISLIGRVPILTATIDETEISNQGTEEVRNRMDGMEERQWDIPLAAWRKIESHEAHLEEVKLNARSLLADDQSRALAMTPQEALKNYGISFPPGTGARYVTSTGSFVVRNTAKNLGVVDRLVQGSLRQLSREQEVLKEYEKNAGDHPFSTFSLNVSDVSFKLAKAALFAGQWPNAEQVRVEEFVNAFDYGDPAPSQAEKVACTMEQAAHPFLQQRNLLRVSMRTAALGRAASTPLRLTVLLDHSGSMDRADRVESVKNAFRLLAAQLNPQDQVTLIGFARTPRLLADRVSGDKVAQLAEVVESTPSEGGTNIEEALELGIAKAKGQLLEGGQNRIILLTDGAANLGNAKPKDLAKIVERMRQQGIAFDACGVGAAGLNDDILESLTRKGDGRYYFLDRPEDADAGFAKRIAGALRPAARNVKVQMNFNPQRVGRYRLYGFEKHRLKKEDFRNDSVDAAEFAAEEAGNAIYQVELLPEGSGDIGTVSVRFQDMESGQMVEKKWTIPYEAQASRLEDSSAALRLASGAALLGEKLKGSPIGEAVEMPRLGKLINGLTADFSSDQQVKDLVQMVNKVRELANE
jgi:Mg-chelatase subunit ChlD